MLRGKIGVKAVVILLLLLMQLAPLPNVSADWSGNVTLSADWEPSVSTETGAVYVLNTTKNFTSGILHFVGNYFTLDANWTLDPIQQYNNTETGEWTVIGSWSGIFTGFSSAYEIYYTVTIEAKDSNGNYLSGVDLYVDGGYVKTFDATTSIQVEPGTHTFKSIKSGYAPSEVTYDVSKDVRIILVMYPSIPTEFNYTFVNLSTLNVSANVSLERILSLFHHWPGGSLLDGLFRLNVSQFIKDVFTFDISVESHSFNWVGMLITGIIWFGAELFAWFYFKNPLPVIALGRVMYEGMAKFATPAFEILQIPIAGFLLYMGYLTIKMMFEKWSGER